jgi:hypothetical protein
VHQRLAVMAMLVVVLGVSFSSSAPALIFSRISSCLNHPKTETIGFLTQIDSALSAEGWGVIESGPIGEPGCPNEGSAPLLVLFRSSHKATAARSRTQAIQITLAIAPKLPFPRPPALSGHARALLLNSTSQMPALSRLCRFVC